MRSVIELLTRLQEEKSKCGATFPEQLPVDDVVYPGELTLANDASLLARS